jgi:transcription antitermination factor NusG
LRFRKVTRRGPIWFVEATFPGYLFAKFVYSEQHRSVASCYGIRGILHFGDRPTTLPRHNASHLFSLELRPVLSVEKDAAGDIG